MLKDTVLSMIDVTAMEVTKGINIRIKLITTIGNIVLMLINWLARTQYFQK